MAFGKLWTLAYRDLRRNTRRTILSMVAVALGLALLMMMNGFIAGVLEDSVQNSIRLNTGHVQVRASGYNEEDLSLRPSDLLADPETVAAQAAALPRVQAAAPVIWAGGMIATSVDSLGIKVYGIDPTSSIYDPIRTATIGGTFLTPDDRNGVLIGVHLAETLGTGVGGNVVLTIVDADGQADEGVFAVRGLFRTGIPTYDDNAVLMPLAKVQAFTNTDRHASAVVVLLDGQSATASVAEALRTPDYQVLTWEDLNRVLLDAMQTGMSFYVVLDFIVILIIAVIIANTLLMSVFERIREMGILASLGMKGRQLMAMFLLEAVTLGLAGLALGAVLGTAVVGYLAVFGIPIGSAASAAGSDFALGTTMYARFVPGTFAGIAAAMLLIIVVAALYPAWYAARLEPVQALRAS